METHFFKNLPGRYKIAYRHYYTGQNLGSVRVGSAIFFVLNAVIRLFYFIFPLSLTHAQNFPEFNITNWVFLASSVVFYLFSVILIEQYKKIKKATAIMALFIFIFSLFILGCGMFSSFIATGSPRNSLTLYLIALTLVSLLFVFEYYETIIIIISGELLFTFLLIYSRADPTEMIYNQLISLILFFGFYLVSRYFYSFKANFYTQVLEIKEKNTEIERASDFKGQLLGTVAHDLRNPIAAVESVAMLMEMDEISAETKENLDMIRASCTKARSIIEELLESARNENTTTFTTEKTELNNLLTDMVEDWKIRQNNENLELISAVYPLYARVNLEKFHRVIDNLVGNALKFSRPNTKVRIFLNRKDDHIIIEVKDQGIGIPANKIPIIFDPFTKAGRPGLNGEQSTGLGLSIVKQIVEKHNGKIEVESEEGKGSTFRIMLPVSS